MGRFVIEGGYPLAGKVKVSGSKNASLPVIFATLITRGVSEITSLPDIEDVRVALELIRELGAEVWRDRDVTYVDTRCLKYRRSSRELIGKIRASTYLLGSKLSRFGRAELSDFGGCSFSDRPIDMHLSALRSFGARVSQDELIILRPHETDVKFRQKSVGATVNALIYASGVAGESTLRTCAREPHIDTLIDYLSSAGAEITVDGDTLRVKGGELAGGRVTIPGDMIEAGTYLAISMATGGRVSVVGAPVFELSSFIQPLVYSGVSLLDDNGAFSLSGLPSEHVEIITSPYPGFPTDLQPIIAPVLALGEGGSITDNVWCERFGYLAELGKMGLGYEVHNNCAKINKSELINANTTSPDLRGGAAILISALSAKGVSEIGRGEIILRGYENPVPKLSALGARVKYIE